MLVIPKEMLVIPKEMWVVRKGMLVDPKEMLVDPKGMLVIPKGMLVIPKEILVVPKGMLVILKGMFVNIQDIFICFVGVSPEEFFNFKCMRAKTPPGRKPFKVSRRYKWLLHPLVGMPSHCSSHTIVTEGYNTAVPSM